MMLVLYLAGSAIAIGLIALLIHRLGHSAEYTFADDADVRAAFMDEYPDAAVERIALGTNQRSALIELGGGEGFGLVRAMGRFFLARQFAANEVRTLRRNGATLRLHLTDYADPMFVIEFVQEEMAVQWQDLLGGMDDRERETTG